MEDMTKYQFVLLVLLVSFFTALVTGIVTVTLVNQAPQPITQTIQKVIERSIGTVSPTPLPVDEAKQLELYATSREILIEDIIARTSPSVVSIIASKNMPVIEQCSTGSIPDDPFLRQFFPDFQMPQYCQKGTQKKDVSEGTGFFVSSDGLILTNKHVVDDAEAEYTIITSAGKKYSTKVLARDPLNDMAVLKVETPANGEKLSFHSLNLGDSDKMKIGQTVIAIGNALGEFQNSVSVGVISGLSRSLTASGSAFGKEELSGIIQTDAAINHGNSGGPLLNLKGEVTAMNTAIAEGAQNIGFAIPINQIKRSLASVKNTGMIIYPILGVRYLTITPEIKDKNKLSVDFGALVVKGPNGESAIVPGSPAEKAGIVAGDIILEFAGIKINVDNSLSKLISEKIAGDKVSVKIMRDGKVLSLEVVLEERKNI